MRKHVNPPDYVFLSLAGVIIVFGLVVLVSASSVFSYERFGSSFYLIRHQLLFGILPGIIVFFAALNMPYSWLRTIAFPLFGIIVLLLILVLIPGVGRAFGGSRSWFTLGTLSFQPSEFAKLGLIIYLAAWFESRQAVLQDLKRGFFPFLAISGTIGMLILLQPDLGTLAIIGATALLLAFVAGIRLIHLAAALAGAAGVFLVLIKIAPYRIARLTTFIHPEFDPQGIGYHINQALLAVGSGGFFGVGFGNSRQKFRYLPEVTGDSIFPIIAEEMGFIVSAGFIILVGILLWRMFKIAGGCPDKFSRFIVLGVAGWFGLQTFVNIGSMVGILPITGLPLPFISYGGTALAAEMAAVGIVGSISRQRI